MTGFDALETYFVTQGREWERYAWIKARPLTGGGHDELAGIVRPFVYRKYLDYATLAAMRSLHAEVRREVARRDLAEHVKLGPGGIREIEFVAQALQLVRAGRDPALAVRPTLQALARLGERGLLPVEAVRELSAAYAFLRNTEHRLQYLDDLQTHTLPGRPGGPRAHRADVRLRLLERVRRAAAGAPRRRAAAFPVGVRRGAGGAGPGRLAGGPRRRGARARGGRLPRRRGERRPARRRAPQPALRRMLPADSRRRVDALVPALAAAAAQCADPDATLARGLDLIEAIARRAAYLALLAEHPEALERVTQDRRRLQLGGASS